MDHAIGAFDVRAGHCCAADDHTVGSVNVKRFAEHASQDSLFLAIEADDPKFDINKTRQFLQGLGAREINEIEA